ncbi:MAG: HupE/UreJ family protein [Vicinamibacterales bacterium]|jgi:uncharacterized membrane protein YhaH (DUF805 family)|nr:hypothetical protein [Acidobacteriota bacterium]MDP6373547.1 HupE/UreJ family protein [Vicinamibacterales bacterium]MDP6610428.1 HupE/UreJ family protein [Vicinamibacterales bacterium]HAK56031.1 hypothetical protein [Acidobacteriota bacterium]|tara:strand:- start:1376 stop:2734 length:1359 start_codon:yes stop_codon:yes gene_type:complete
MSSTRRHPGSSLIHVTLVLASLASAVPSSAQPIVDDVTALAIIKPDGQQLRMVVRMPLGGLRDLEFPTYGIGYLDLPRADPALREAARRRIAADLRLYENGVRVDEPRVVAVRVSLPSDRSFATYDGAVAHLRSPPLRASTELYWEQGMLDVLFEFPIASDRSDFSIDTLLERPEVRVNMALTFVPPDGAEQVFDYTGNPGRIWLDPRWHRATRRFVAFGFAHAFDGLDHLVFLLCLVAPFRRARSLAVIVGGFGVGYSVTLTASAFRLAPTALWFPPLVETVVAFSVLYVAFENMIGPRLDRRAVGAFGFGLVHGFGLAFALPDLLQFGGRHRFISRLAFNAGLDLAMLLVLAMLVPILVVTFRRVDTRRIGIIVFSVFIAHSGWHWLSERAGAFGQFGIQAPTYDLFFFASVMRWAMLLVLAVGIAWLGRTFLDLSEPAPDDGADAVPPR